MTVPVPPVWLAIACATVIEAAAAGSMTGGATGARKNVTTSASTATSAGVVIAAMRRWRDGPDMSTPITRLYRCW
ncbi:hypothetical protein Adu01nite_84220 [Paractinoplanes durhamensis]|uniref:Secreted protein n=1 Tax=Paractinoplanes durhamensis TaxID=113563 RepID=A0ABQ3ZB73_9ACTN|nr:hypothetical protein Adu01nite_84220 [Actinoplanes durhamensis]